MTAAAPIPRLARLLLGEPERILARLADAAAAGRVDHVPNAWQLTLGVLRMWHRALFRTDTIGTCPGGTVRPTRRARLLANRALRLPALLAEGAVAPLDFTGLRSPRARLLRHLLGAHHDKNDFVYDLEILALEPGGLEALCDAAAAVVDADTPRARWLRDLTVFEGYHEDLLAAGLAALTSGPVMSAADAADPDVSLRAYLAWCAARPATPADTVRALRAGRFRFDSPLPASGPVGLDQLLAMSRAELGDALAHGHPIDPAALADVEYHGVSLGLPRWVDRLTWKKFTKAFHRDDDGGLRGWNVRVAQDGLAAPWRALERGGRPVTFGHFRVRPPGPRDRAPAASLLLDYAAARRPLDPLTRLRDPIVALHAGSSELLLGWSYLDLGVAAAPTPSYFALVRGGPLGHIARPPA